jgi:hypothetical protein
MRFKASIFLMTILILSVCVLFAEEGEALGETPFEELPAFRERAVIMRISSRIVEQNQQVVWNSENTRITLPGRPVGIKLLGTDLVVAVQFTPFIRPNGRNVLVAQGQIWINVPNEGISYRTTMQTIPIEWGELIYFFPLGSARAEDEAGIEIQLVLEPYTRQMAGSDSSPAHPRGPARTRGRNIPP